MATLLKERARKPVIDQGAGYALTRFIDGKMHYGFSIREPWQSDGKHQTFDLLLTEAEMLSVMSEWTKTLAHRGQP